MTCKQRFKKTFSIIVALAIVFTTMASTGEVYAQAETSITFLAPVLDSSGNVQFDAQGNVIFQEKTWESSDYFKYDGKTNNWGENGKTKIVLYNNVTIGDVSVEGDVELILCQDAAVETNKITLKDGASLTIYGKKGEDNATVASGMISIAGGYLCYW